MKFKFSSKSRGLLMQRKYTQSTAIITPQSMHAHHIPHHHSPATTVHVRTPQSNHYHSRVGGFGACGLRFGGQEKKEGTQFAEEKGTRFAEARTDDLQRRRAHDLHSLGHTICRGGGNTFFHQRRAHGRRKWYDLFLLSLDFPTSFP